MSDVRDVQQGDGFAVANLDGLGDGPGFRKIRRELGVTAFGMNAIVLPAGMSTGTHWHERQEEVYFVHAGTIEFEFGDDPTRHRLGPGGIARVDAQTPRRIHNVGDGEATYVIVGGADGYVGRDGRAPEGTARVGGPPGAPG
jgi:mannose-6-phosphate isomerase-like protein (cupin superfamily)